MMPLDPDCHYGDHHWRGGSCSLCGKPFRCICGQFADFDTFNEHLRVCPSLRNVTEEEEEGDYVPSA